MNPYNITPHPVKIIGGYFCATLTATLVAAFLLMGVDGAEFLPLVVIGGIYVVASGLPGFVATVVAAQRFGWTGWLPFTVAGGLNAVLAWLLVGAATGDGIGLSPNGMLLASVRAGAAGGVAYWWFAYRGQFAEASKA